MNNTTATVNCQTTTNCKNLSRRRLGRSGWVEVGAHDIRGRPFIDGYRQPWTRLSTVAEIILTRVAIGKGVNTKAL